MYCYKYISRGDQAVSSAVLIGGGNNLVIAIWYLSLTNLKKKKHGKMGINNIKRLKAHGSSIYQFRFRILLDTLHHISWSWTTEPVYNERSFPTPYC